MGEIKPSQFCSELVAKNIEFLLGEESVNNINLAIQEIRETTMLMRGTIQLDLSKATEAAPAKSEPRDIGGHQWRLIYLISDDSFDRFAVVCNENVTGELWACKIKISAETKEGNSDWEQFAELSEYRFNSYNKSATKFKGNGLLTPNSIKVNIQVEWSASLTNLPHLDASLAMIFGKKSDLVPVNKFVLASHSNYFRSFFFGELAAVSKRKDSNWNPIFDIREDPDFNSCQFRFMVHALLCMDSMLDKLEDVAWEDNDKEQKIALLKLAVKYQLQMFVDFAEKALIKLGPGTMELLALADKYTLAGLKHHCLESITTVDYRKEIVKNTEISAGLGKETRAQLAAKLKR